MQILVSEYLMVAYGYCHNHTLWLFLLSYHGLDHSWTLHFSVVSISVTNWPNLQFLLVVFTPLDVNFSQWLSHSLHRTPPSPLSTFSGTNIRTMIMTKLCHSTIIVLMFYFVLLLQHMHLLGPSCGGQINRISFHLHTIFLLLSLHCRLYNHSSFSTFCSNQFQYGWLGPWILNSTLFLHIIMANLLYWQGFACLFSK